MILPSARKLFLPTLAACPLMAAAAAQNVTLWTSDDVTKTIHHITLDGDVIFSFASDVISGLAVDPVDATIWAANEGFNRIVHYDRDGTELSFFEGTVVHPEITMPEGVAVDYLTGTLWITDDETTGVYNAEKDGTLISTFKTGSFDANSVSPQGIAADPDGSLWITDNQTKTIYNVTTQGFLLSSFPTSAYADPANNPQGISVDALDGTLWITDRFSHSVYHVARDGTLIGEFDSNIFGSNDPTGVAFDDGSVCSTTKYCGVGQNSNNTAFLDIDTCDSSSPNVVLSLSNGPPGQFTYLLVGNGNGTISMPPGAKGDLCIVGGSCLGRFDQDIGQISSAGTFTTDIQNAASSPCNGAPIVVPGTTWYFQYWHRQPMGQPATFSEALKVTFD